MSPPPNSNYVSIFMIKYVNAYNVTSRQYTVDPLDGKVQLTGKETPYILILLYFARSLNNDNKKSKIKYHDIILILSFAILCELNYRYNWSFKKI